jgi:hypothetical protein
LKNHGGTPGDQSVKAHLHDGARLPGQFLKKLNGEQRRHSLLFSTIPSLFKANLLARNIYGRVKMRPFRFGPVISGWISGGGLFDIDTAT